MRTLLFMMNLHYMRTLLFMMYVHYMRTLLFMMNLHYMRTLLFMMNLHYMRTLLFMMYLHYLRTLVSCGSKSSEINPIPKKWVYLGRLNHGHSIKGICPRHNKRIPLTGWWRHHVQELITRRHARQPGERTDTYYKILLHCFSVSCRHCCSYVK